MNPHPGTEPESSNRIMNISLILATALGLIANTTSRASVVIDNLATGTQSSSTSLSGPTAFIRFFGPFANREVSFSFTTDSNDSMLTELAFTLGIGSIQLDPIQVTLSTGSSAPGGSNPIVLGSVAPTSLTPMTQLLTVTPAQPTALSANTQYWVLFSVPSGSSIYTIGNSDAPVIEPGWTLGTTWYRNPNTTWEELDSGPLAKVRLSVETVVPEPSCALLGGISMLLLLKRKRPASLPPA